MAGTESAGDVSSAESDTRSEELYIARCTLGDTVEPLFIEIRIHER